MMILKDKPKKMIDLGDTLGISYASMTNLKDRLLELGLVETVAYPKDRRCCFIKLSETGSKMLEELFKAQITELQITDFHNSITDDNMLYRGKGSLLFALEQFLASKQ